MKKITRKTIMKNYRNFLTLCVESRNVYRKDHLTIAFHRWGKPSTLNEIEALRYKIDAAWERAVGYLEALLDEDIITCDEYRKEVNKLNNTMSIKNMNTWY